MQKLKWPVTDGNLAKQRCKVRRNSRRWSKECNNLRKSWMGRVISRVKYKIPGKDYYHYPCQRTFQQLWCLCDHYFPSIWWQCDSHFHMKWPVRKNLNSVSQALMWIRFGLSTISSTALLRWFTFWWFLGRKYTRVFYDGRGTGSMHFLCCPIIGFTIVLQTAIYTREGYR